MLMTAGPTDIPERVRNRMAAPIQYHRQEEFTEFYLDVTEKLERLFDDGNDALIMAGEGMLGLEAAMASTIDEGDTVLCVSNGHYAEGFADFVEMYDGEAVMCSAPYDEHLDPVAVKDVVAEHDFDIATAVHCETPSGTMNDLEEILAFLQEEGIITIVDVVSSLGGVPTPTEHCDISLCASQKVLSSPTGLSLVSVSDRAWEKIGRTDDDQFYTSLQPWKDMWVDEHYLPYSHMVSNVYALDESLDMLFEEGLENVHDRHAEVAQFCRDRGAEMGLDIYPAEESLSAETVTAFEVDGISFDIKKRVKDEHGIVIATGVGLENEEDVIRVGHMGYNAQRDRVAQTMDAMESVLDDLR
jgi:aspartate aminotransferase-like enzyme